MLTVNYHWRHSVVIIVQSFNSDKVIQIQLSLWLSFRLIQAYRVRISTNWTSWSTTRGSRTWPRRTDSSSIRPKLTNKPSHTRSLSNLDSYPFKDADITYYFRKHFRLKTCINFAIHCRTCVALLVQVWLEPKKIFATTVHKSKHERAMVWVEHNFN